jgi:hypothetical protein
MMSWVWWQAVMGLIGLLHAVAAFFYFSKARYAAVWAGAWLLLTVLCDWFLPAWPIVVTIVFFFAVLCWTIWWESIRALVRRDWVAEDARQATGELVGDRLAIRNLRNFEWRGRHDFVPRWEDRIYDLNTLDALDLFVCTWTDLQVAHLILSFVFRAAPPLAFSIETRRETTEKWSILAGFMKSYELIMIAADERDVVRVRTNIRGERVHRYRLVSTPAMRRNLLVRYVEELNDLAVSPRFYNTIFRNCTTEVARLLNAAGRPLPFDWRIIVSGYVPQYLYRIGLIAARRPFAQIKNEADVVAKARAADTDPAFSASIRRVA